MDRRHRDVAQVRSEPHVVTDQRREIKQRTSELKAAGEKLTPEEIAEHTKSLVGFNYTVDDYYEIGREEVRKHALAVQDPHPTHWTSPQRADSAMTP